jgi:hypothetical protein
MVQLLHFEHIALDNLRILGALPFSFLACRRKSISFSSWFASTSITHRAICPPAPSTSTFLIASLTPPLDVLFRNGCRGPVIYTAKKNLALLR